MSAMILCRGKVADNPLYIMQSGIRLYTEKEPDPMLYLSGSGDPYGSAYGSPCGRRGLSVSAGYPCAVYTAEAPYDRVRRKLPDKT